MKVNKKRGSALGGTKAVAAGMPRFATAVWGIAFLTLGLSLALAACDNGGGDDPPANTTGGITYTVEQTGGANGSANSTGIKFTFNADVTGLTADNITLTAIDGEATKGNPITGSAKDWNLPITVTTAGKVKVKITKDGIESTEKEVAVYKAGAVITPPNAARMASGKISNSNHRNSIRPSIAGGMYRAVTTTDEQEPFVLYIDSDATAPEGTKALTGRVQVNADTVIVLEGLLDNTSGKFVAAGVDSDTIGIGIQIEGFYKNDTLSDVKAIVKVKNMDTGEWQEQEVTPTNSEENITATETTEQEPGLPAAWCGRYKFNISADSWADSIDGFYANPYPGNPRGTEDISLGEAVKDILAGDYNVFVLVAPMAWSVVVDYAKIDPLLRARLTEKGFTDVDGAMTLLHNRLGYFEEFYYCGFLEVEQGTGADSDSYYALAFNIVLSLDPDDQDNKGKWFTRYKIYKSDEAEMEYLNLARARDLQYNPWGDGYTPIDGIAETADAARGGSVFTDAEGADPGITWMFIK